MLTKKAEKAAKEYARNTKQEDLCVAKVTSGDHVRPGPYNVLPILCSMHKNKNRPFLLLTSFLLRIADEAHVGVLNWMLPFNEHTEETIARLLVSLGWDGRVWPEEPGWPGDFDKSTDREAVGLRELLKGQNLLATLTFPPDPENGNATLRQEVLRTSADFPLNPDVRVGTKDPTPEMIEKLRKFALDPSVFGTGITTAS
jgi:hypothetical protein